MRLVHLRHLPRSCRRGLGRQGGRAVREEEDQLDNAFDVRPNSRLSCQIAVTEALDGSSCTPSYQGR
jgi:ferredoxin